MEGGRKGGEEMDQIAFYRALKAHCSQAKAECETCCLRLYCYTPPCERTDSMMEKVISFLDLEQNHTEGHERSGHYNCVHQLPCPCTLDMTTALGFSDRP